MKTNGENGTAENENETKTESESLKTEEKPTHSSKTEPTHSPTTQASLLASMAEAQNGLENKSNLISETIKNFGLDRFTGNGYLLTPYSSKIGQNYGFATVDLSFRG